MLSTPRKKILIIIYDGDRPFCSNYIQLLSLKKTTGDVTLVNARHQDSVHIKEAVEYGLDPNDSMALKVEQHRHHGAECINILGLMSSQHSWFNRANYLIFRSPRFARLFILLLNSEEGSH